jgi:acetyl esterase/lipase
MTNVERNVVYGMHSGLALLMDVYRPEHPKGYGVSAERIGACGGSSGGHLVSLLGTLSGGGETSAPDPVNRESARVQCVVARAAPVDLGQNMNPAVADFMGMIPRGEAGGAYSLEQQTYREASPITHVSSDTAPFLLLAGTLDTAVPPAQARLMQEALEAAGVPVEVLWIDGAGHGPHFPGAHNPPDYLGALVRWFDRHLVPAALGSAASGRSA